MADNGLFERIYNPDVLSCLANLSNDEVFTPPEVANAMLDMLPQELFRSLETKFLDPACKSGVFLREIAKRLIEGRLPGWEKRARAIDDKKRGGVAPDAQDAAFLATLQATVDHIMHRQLYGIAITELTSLISRRSVYCSKWANSRYSVTHFDAPDGNIRFKRTQHSWQDGKCVYCGASKEKFDRGDELETHAYEFLHRFKPEEIWGMKFDVIISNPPYQLSDGGGNGASAKPIYDLFIRKAKALRPKYITMITPSRWFSGGKGLDEFRDEMLHDEELCEIHDYPEATDCFSGVQIKGGVSYFLWERDRKGLCTVFTHKGQTVSEPMTRPLLERDCDSFIRYNEAISILHKVQAIKAPSMEDLVSVRMPFGLANTFKGHKEKQSDSDLQIYVTGNDRDIRGSIAYVSRGEITKGFEMIPWEKVYIAKAGSGSDTFPHSILTKPFYGAPYTICSESYLVIGGFKNKAECENVMSYIATKLFRFLVLLKKNSQNAAKGVYQLVPQQDFSKLWTDEELYAKYGITDEEIAFIDSMIRPMDLSGGDD